MPNECADAPSIKETVEAANADVTETVGAVLDGGINVQVEENIEVSTDALDEPQSVLSSQDDLDFVNEDEGDVIDTEEKFFLPEIATDPLDVVTDALEENSPTIYHIADDMDMTARAALILGKEIEAVEDLSVILNGVCKKDFLKTLEKIYELHPNWDKSGADDRPLDPEGFMIISSLIKSLDTTANMHNVPVGKMRNFIFDEEHNRKVAVSRVRPKLNKGLLAGDSIALDISTTMDGVIRVRAPMAASGFTIELSNFSGEDITFLDMKLANNLGELGRSSVGSVRMHSTNLLVRDIVNFIMDHMTGHNIEGVGLTDKSTVRGLIEERDIATLITAANAATKPDGGSVSVMCANPNKTTDGKYVCQAYHTGTVLYPRTFWVDTEALTATQLDILTRPYSQRVTLEELAAYRQEFDVSEPILIENEQYTYKFYPGYGSMDEFLKDGASFINGIGNAITKHLGTHLDKEMRDRATAKALSQNLLTMYYSNVKRILITAKDSGRETTVTDKQTIIKVLQTNEQNPKVESMLNDLATFNSKNPTVIAVDAPACPKCGYKTENELIVYNALTSFFTQVLPKAVGLQFIATPT